MKALLLGLLVVSFVACENPIKEVIEKVLLVTKEFTEELRRRVTWEVQDYENNIFKGWTDAEFKASLGDRPISNADDTFSVEEPNTTNSAAESQDWSMDSCVHEIRDQGKCGSCWAFSAASIVSDRCCLKGADHGWLSSQEILSCETDKSKGCEGGDRQSAFDYAAKNGLVPESCMPYAGTESQCPSTCQNGKGWLESHVCKCTNVKFCRGEKGIISCLLSGPLGVGMKVYADFMYYKSGVYKWDGQSEFKGNHAIKLVGYGPGYWKCANSWGKSWGDQGYFKIGRGEADMTKGGGLTCDVVP